MEIDFVIPGMAGVLEELNRLMFCPEKQESSGKRNTSLCWTCARCYALPDPDGCGFHRMDHRPVYDRAETRYTPFGGLMVCVTDCAQYQQTPKGQYHPEETAGRKKRDVQPREPYGKAMLDKAMQLYESGMSGEEVSKMCGISRPTIYKYWKEYQAQGYITWPRPRQLTIACDYAQIAQMRDSGMQFTEIARTLGYKPNSCQNAYKRYKKQQEAN